MFENEKEGQIRVLGKVLHEHKKVDSEKLGIVDENDDETSKERQKALEGEFRGAKAIFETKYPELDFEDCKTVGEIVKRAKEYMASLSLGKRGSDVTPLTREQLGYTPSYDPTEQAESGRELITSLYDELERLSFKRDFRKGLEGDESKRLQKLQLKRNKLLRSLRIGELSRSTPTRFQISKCPICGDVIVGRVCSRCSYRYGQKVDPEKREEWALRSA